MDPSLLRPSTVWYWIAGIIGLAGVAIAVVLFVGFVGSLINDLNGPLTHLRAPGEATIELDAGAKRTIYRQIRDASGPIAVAPGAQVECTVARGGTEIEVGDAFDWTLERDADRYKALFDFEAPEPGGYRVTCQSSGNAAQPVPLAIGETFGLLDFLKRLGGVLGAFFGGLGIACTIAIVTVVRRDHHKRRLQQEAVQRAAAGLG